MVAIWNGKYTRTDGSVVEGPSIRDLCHGDGAGCGDARRRRDAGDDGQDGRA